MDCEPVKSSLYPPHVLHSPVLIFSGVPDSGAAAAQQALRYEYRDKISPSQGEHLLVWCHWWLCQEEQQLRHPWKLALPCLLLLLQP